MSILYRPARAEDLQRAGELVTASINDLCERHGFAPTAAVRPTDVRDTPGGEVARIPKPRPLPNAFGFGDIFGRKVETGLIQFVYGKAMIRRIDIDVLSTATTMSRTPGFITRQAWSQGHARGTFPRGSGQINGTASGGAHVFGMSPIDETNTVLPPRAVDFLADPSCSSFSRPSGYCSCREALLAVCDERAVQIERGGRSARSGRNSS